LEQYLTIGETAQLLDVTDRTVRRLAKRGLLTKTKCKGRVLFSDAEVKQLKHTRSTEGTLGVIYRRVETLTRKQAVLEARVAILEIALSSRQSSVALDTEQVRAVRSAVTSTCKSRDLTFSDVVAWSDDLLRLDREACKAVGIKRLRKLADKLILVGDESPEALGDASKSIHVDKLTIFRDRLGKYSKA